MAKKRASKKTTKKATTAKATTKKAPAKKAPAKKPVSAKATAKPLVESTTKRKPAAKKVAAKQATKKRPAVPSQTGRTGQAAAGAKRPMPKRETRIVVTVDVGFGNTLYLRGEGAGLSWEQGVPMKNAGGSRWTFSAPTASADLEVKFLINDVDWCAGENVRVRSGEETAVTPTF